MTFQIDMRLPEDIEMYISFNGSEERISNSQPSVKFLFEKCGEYQVCFYQKKTPKKMSKLEFFTYLLACVFQGIFNIFLMNTQMMWINRINPYCVKAEIDIELVKNTKITARIKKSVYEKRTDSWSMPELIINSDVYTNMEYIPNFFDFRKQYFWFVRKFGSLYLIAFLLFFPLLYYAIKNNNLIAICILSTLILCLIATLSGVLFIQYKKMNKLYKSFKTQCNY